MQRTAWAYSSLLLCCWSLACSKSPSDDSSEQEKPTSTTAGGGESGGSTSAPVGSGGDRSLGASNSTAGTTSTLEACVAETAKTERRPVYLAFAFDVSGSMGKLDKEWHDPELKWKPVVAATEAFFAAPSSVGISASLTFFPAEESKCDAETYDAPDVPMTLLPSTDFADAIAAVTPETADDWRGNTPTLAVLKGVYGQLEQVTAEHPDASVAVVLVTDGYPQGCDDDDDEISSVEAEVQAHPNVRTYVIGVENPPLEDAPDTVSNLNAIAVAGGTESAFLIHTGDPTATSTQLSTVVESIRGKTISCELDIPVPPTGETLDTNAVNVTYGAGDEQIALVYDPACGSANAWHFDNETAPKTVVLCPMDCTTVMADPVASVVIEFGCKRRDSDIL